MYTRPSKCDPRFLINDCGVVYREIPMKPEELAFRCYVCGHGFSDMSSLKQHEGSVHGMFRCTYSGCSQAFPHARTLAMHESTFHKPLRCASCDVVVRGSSMIPKHLSECHGQQVPFQCVCWECNVFFLSPIHQASRATSTCRSHAPRLPVKKAVRIGTTVRTLVGNEAEYNSSELTEEIHLGIFLEQLLMDVSAAGVQTPAATTRRLHNIYQFDYVD